MGFRLNPWPILEPFSVSRPEAFLTKYTGYMVFAAGNAIIVKFVSQPGSAINFLEGEKGTFYGFSDLFSTFLPGTYGSL